MTEKTGSPYDMDGSTFDSEQYLQKILKVCIMCMKLDTPRIPYNYKFIPIVNIGLYAETSYGH